MPDERETHPPLTYPPVPHYYGDIARKLFLGGAIVMLLSLPLEPDVLPTTFIFSTLAIIALTFLAGLTSPKARSIIVIDTIFAALMFALFEYFAVYYTKEGGQIFDTTFLVQQLLALNFLLALYFCSKTWRGMSTLRWI